MARAEPLIGLEVTPKKIKLVELVTKTEGIEVTNFALLDLPPGGLKAAGPMLQSFLKEKAFLGKRINALLSYPSIDYLQVLLPPMGKAELKLAALREAKKDAKLPEGELVYGHDVVGEAEEKGIPKKEVLIARASAKDVSEYLQVLKEANLYFNFLSVVPAVLLNLYKMREELKEETVALVSVGEEKGTIVILHKGGLRFPRDFPLKLTGETGGLQSRLAAELKRSLLYLKQRARGLEPQRIILLGDIGKPQEVVETLTQEVGIKTEQYLPPGLDLSPLGDRMQEFRDSLQQFIIPIGLAWNGAGRSELNLLAQEVQMLKKVRQTRVAVIATAAVFLIVIMLRLLWLWTDGKPHWQNLKKAREELALLQPKVEEIARVSEERTRQESKVAFMGKLRGPEADWEDILRTLSLIIPQEMYLELLELMETPEAWTLKLKGQVLGADVSLIHNRFKEFFSLFLTSPALAEGKVESLKIGPSEKEKEGKPPSSKLEFAVVVKVE
jgi:Tfp pilus assembly PilM family ATPase